MDSSSFTKNPISQANYLCAQADESIRLSRLPILYYHCISRASDNLSTLFANTVRYFQQNQKTGYIIKMYVPKKLNNQKIKPTQTGLTYFPHAGYIML